MKKIITLSLVAATLLFTACGEKPDEKTTKAVESTKTAAHDIAEASKEVANKAMLAAKEASAQAKLAADKAVQASKEAADKAMEEAKAAVDKTGKAVTAGTAAAMDSLSNDAGKEAYAKCKGCHGEDGKTKALGKSAEIAGKTKEEILAMLKEYKAGTRNVAGMGTLMKTQVASMDDASMEAVAAYISTLK